MHHILDQAKTLYGLEDCTFTPAAGHEGGRNDIFIVRRNGENQYVLRVSALGDRSEEEYLAETEFVRYLAQNGAPVTDVIPSIRGNLVERMEAEVKAVYVSLFAYAKGMLIVDNGYRYREGAPLSEYFFNIGKARNENDPGKRFELLWQCFDLQLQGYKTETDIAEEMLKQLPTFIDMVLIENIVDEFECCEREGEELDYEDIEDAARCLIESIQYAGFGQN